MGGSFAGFAAGGYYPDDPTVPGYATQSQGDNYVSIEAVVGSAYDDLVYGAWAGTVARLGGGDDVFDNYGPSNAQDKVYGQAGDDRIWTGGGADWLFGGAGSDGLHGEGGGDVIAGGSGDDLIDGGSGADLIRFGLTADDGHDTILLFQQGLDRIDLADGIDLDAVLAGQQLQDGGDLVIGYPGALAFSATLTGLGAELTAADFI